MNILFLNYNEKVKLVIKRLIINNKIYILSKEKYKDFLEYSNIKYINNNEIKKEIYDYVILNIDENFIKEIHNFEKFYNNLYKFLNIIKFLNYKRCILLINYNIKYYSIYKNFYYLLFKELKTNTKKEHSIIEYKELNINSLFNIENIINYKEKFRYKKV